MSEVSSAATAPREQQRSLAAGPSGGRVAGAAGERRLPLELAAAALQVAPQRRGGLVAQRHDAHLAALAAHDELRLGRLHVAQAQRDELLLRRPHP